ncbi:MAG: 30S ribosomal protein S9 [Bacteroidetes bacterium]|nr:30S ribosomal protein S9 [Bacteroidota bacterium]
MEVTNTSGRRKTSVARIYVKAGNGNILINEKPYDQYFTTLVNQFKVIQPLQLTDNVGKYDIKVNVDGGGVTGQAEAVRLAISKSLCEINPEHRLTLKPIGLLRRDDRMVERKKPGQKKARKRFQFSKR